MSPQTDSQREDSEKEVTKLYGSYTLAVPRRNAEFTPTKRTAVAEENVTPKKKRMECLKELLRDSSTQIDTNITSALYNISKSQCNEATITLERTRRLVTIQQHRATALLDEMHLERSANVQKLDALSARELFLHRENVKQASEIKALKEENLKLKSENTSICKEHAVDSKRTKMPKLKKKPQNMIKKEDKFRKQVPPYTACQFTQESGTHPAHHSVLPGALVLHDYMFHGLNPDSVLRGEIDIVVMDFFSAILKNQFGQMHGLIPPSIIYQQELISEQPYEGQLVPEGSDAVQIHFLNSHYVISSKSDQTITIYDSLRNSGRVTLLTSQLGLRSIGTEEKREDSKVRRIKNERETAARRKKGKIQQYEEREMKVKHRLRGKKREDPAVRRKRNESETPAQRKKGKIQKYEEREMKVKHQLRGKTGKIQKYEEREMKVKHQLRGKKGRFRSTKKEMKRNESETPAQRKKREDLGVRITRNESETPAQRKKGKILKDTCKEEKREDSGVRRRKNERETPAKRKKWKIQQYEESEIKGITGSEEKREDLGVRRKGNESETPAQSKKGKIQKYEEREMKVKHQRVKKSIRKSANSFKSFQNWHTKWPNFYLHCL
ncbi:hypothetical protein MAR_026754 [Mya arenaria]|uniref:Uncharacterized protein n=1 Tax=Mya arenaria TaxID=6604 RepID=A0ABY7EVX1_MYAAR|nr:hypothetical protein MAR_026754 [Mya arenaria]